MIRTASLNTCKGSRIKPWKSIATRSLFRNGDRAEAFSELRRRRNSQCTSNSDPNSPASRAIIIIIKPGRRRGLGHFAVSLANRGYRCGETPPPQGKAEGSQEHGEQHPQLAPKQEP